MIKSMTIRAPATAAALTMASAAQASNDPAFAIYLCSGATRPVHSGSARTRCVPEPIVTMTRGIVTGFREEVFGGERIDGVLYYLIGRAPGLVGRDIWPCSARPCSLVDSVSGGRAGP